ncbi:MAG: hypothetical protein A3H60_00410 [Candidatus Zambryskibacteria bacterium RIFCSPLOWO2_02_FULL_44_12b]|uniref:FtsK domain-containing protein n=2 Tax=Candidatus Zambryskiibacteriota TaxID=1817925 RepID=A0A1G2UJN8_9BACT|nr:MAG: hypothetical protein A3H60_00410 [Candidatus Zambryskibacteria bacterium RIFCSPLOWO2_02_FULL_44_12b]
MARNQKKKFKSNSHGVVSVLQLISRETLNAITGVFSLVLAIFLVLSAFEKAGRVGSVAYEWLFYLFGIGYYLLPLVFFLLTISFIQNRKREFALPQFLGSFLLFVSALGLVNLVSSNGGLVGGFISRPLASLFDTYVSAILLLALVVISILIIFDASIKIDIISLIKRVFSREEKKVGGELVAREDAEVDKAVEKVEKIETRMNPVPRKTKNDDDGFSPMLMRKSGKAWTPPPLSLLEGDRGKPGVGDIKANANLIKRTLLNFGIVVEMDEISIGPSVTRYALKPAEGVKLSKILGLQNNLELALAAHPVRIEAPIPGKSLVGIEVPNTLKSTIGLGSLISDEEYARSTQPLFLALGRDISGRSHFANFAKMPHLLIAGATGAGKSVSIHAIINSLLFRNPPENLKFIMIDPKRVELPVYNNIPHLLTPVITDPKRAILALKWAAKEMERRYDILEKTSVRDIESYHENILVPGLKKISKKEEQELDPMPFIVIIIDELADLMQSYPRELESAVVRLAQMSRAVGIHLILSTQRPSVNIITGLIKANVPARIAFQVVSQIDSRTILDMSGAEKLLGAGDMLFLSGEMSKPVRIQGAYISENEVKSVVKHLRDSYVDELTDEINFTNRNATGAIFSTSLEEDSFDGDDDELYEEAKETVIHAGKASTSYLQRKLRIGYARAARLMDMLEERGVIGAGSGAKPREVMSGSEGIPEKEEEEAENTGMTSL